MPLKTGKPRQQTSLVIISQNSQFLKTLIRPELSLFKRKVILAYDDGFREGENWLCSGCQLVYLLRLLHKHFECSNNPNVQHLSEVFFSRNCPKLRPINTIKGYIITLPQLPFLIYLGYFLHHCSVVLLFLKKMLIMVYTIISNCYVKVIKPPNTVYWEKGKINYFHPSNSNQMQSIGTGRHIGVMPISNPS